MYITDYEQFYSWLLDQKANGHWDKFSKFIDNRIGVERENVMMHLSSLSRENKEAINSLIGCRAVIAVLEELRDLPSRPAAEIMESVGIDTDYRS